MTNQNKNVDVGSRMKLEYVVWSHKHNSKIMYQYYVTEIPTHSCLHEGISTINKEPTSPTHSSPTRDQNLIKQRWNFPYWRMDDPCALVKMNITFKSWRFNVINLSLKAWHHTMQSLPSNPNVLCEDQNPPPSVYKKKSSCECNSTIFNY